MMSRQLELEKHLDIIQENIEKEIGIAPGELFLDFEKNDRGWQDAKISEITYEIFAKRQRGILPFDRKTIRNLIYTILLLRSINETADIKALKVFTVLTDESWPEK